MPGHVAKKGNNYYIVLEFEEEDGKRRRRWISVRKELGLNRPAKRKEADKLLRDKLKELDEGTYIEPVDITLKEYARQWLEDYAKPNVKLNTYKSYRGIVEDHIIPALGHISLPKLRKSKIKGFIAEKQKEGARADKKEGRLSNTTVRYIFVILKNILKHAVEDEIIKRNPAEGISPPRSDNKFIHNLNYWNREEAQRFLEYVKNHRRYPFYLLAVTTGMRRGELLGLKWACIDWKKCRIEVKYNLIAGEKGKAVLQDSTKSGRSRTIEVSPKIMQVLADHRLYEQQKILSLGVRGKTQDLVFTSDRGTPITPDTIDRQFYRFIKEAGLRRIRFHDLRHTAATLMLEEGADVKTVAEYLGHVDPSVLLNIYSHITARMQKKAAETMEDLI